MCDHWAIWKIEPIPGLTIVFVVARLADTLADSKVPKYLMYLRMLMYPLKIQGLNSLAFAFIMALRRQYSTRHRHAHIADFRYQV